MRMTFFKFFRRIGLVLMGILRSSRFLIRGLLSQFWGFQAKWTEIIRSIRSTSSPGSSAWSILPIKFWWRNEKLKPIVLIQGLLRRFWIWILLGWGQLREAVRGFLGGLRVGSRRKQVNIFLSKPKLLIICLFLLGIKDQLLACHFPAEAANTVPSTRETRQP